jgi:hypothetical protein
MTLRFGLIAATFLTLSSVAQARSVLTVDCIANSSPHFVSLHFDIQSFGYPTSVNYIDNTPHSMDSARIVDFRNRQGELFLNFYDQYTTLGAETGFILRASGDNSGLENGAIYQGTVARFHTNPSTGRVQEDMSLPVQCSGSL